MIRKDIERVILCQSAVRGFLVRGRMKRVKNEYLRIVAEIEGPAADPSTLRTDPIIGPAGPCSDNENTHNTHNDSPYNKISTDGNFKHLSSSSTSPHCVGLDNLSVEELEELKVKTAFELIWVHDSVQTRKEYLRS